MSIPVWFIPNRVGEYEIACSQLCGLGHFRMRGFITIQSAADYKKWYDAQEERTAAGTGGDHHAYGSVSRTSDFVLRTFRERAPDRLRVPPRVGRRAPRRSRPRPPVPGS